MSNSERTKPPIDFRITSALVTSFEADIVALVILAWVFAKLLAIRPF